MSVLDAHQVRPRVVRVVLPEGLLDLVEGKGGVGILLDLP